MGKKPSSGCVHFVYTFMIAMLKVIAGLECKCSKWAIFGKQNWRCGMNRTLGYGAKVSAHQILEKVLVHPDSRTVVMEVEIR